MDFAKFKAPDAAGLACEVPCKEKVHLWWICISSVLSKLQQDLFGVNYCVVFIARGSSYSWAPQPSFY